MSRGGSRIFSNGGRSLKNLKKQSKKALTEKFWPKIAFFWRARARSKLIYIGAFRKILESVGQKWIS